MREEIQALVPVIESLVPSAYVLFADDDPDQLGMMKVWAESLGWKGEYVNSADAIIEAVNRNCSDDTDKCYDAIIADVNYERMFGTNVQTGITAARAIRKTGQDIPIIFVSGHVNSVIREEARRVSAEIYKKPVELDTLFLNVAHLIRWHRLGVSEDYDGSDRRRSSINRTDNKRRATDNKAEAPKIITQLLREAQASYNTGGNK